MALARNMLNCVVVRLGWFDSGVAPCSTATVGSEVTLLVIPASLLRVNKIQAVA
jgi:galactitol-specific phosphotransferase system IIC component